MASSTAPAALRVRAFPGITTLQLAVNPPDVTIETMDLDLGSFQEADQHPSDKSLSEPHFAGNDRIACRGVRD